MQCPICYEDPLHPHVLECKHAFCAGCIVKWFRTGAKHCPMCADTGENGSQTELRYLTVTARASLLRRQARRRDAPPQLKAAVKRLRAAEASHRAARARESAFRKEHKERICQFVKLRSSKWRAARRECKLRRELGVLVCDGLRLPTMIARVKPRPAASPPPA